MRSRLLAPRSLLNDHPQEDPEFINGTRHLKPMWWYEVSYEWVTGANEITRKVYTEAELHEGVVVGDLGKIMLTWTGQILTNMCLKFVCR